MSELLQDYEQRPAARPVFLTVLCILTFVGSGWGLISGAITYFTAEKQAQAMSISKDKAADDIQKSGKNDKGTKMAEKMVTSISNSFTPENLKKTAIFSMLAAVLCLAGAFMMWNLKKTGYYLYIAGILLSIISPFVIFGSDNLMAIITSIGGGFIGIVFLILYGVNLKHMK